LRWVLARFRPLLSTRFMAAACVPATAIAAARLLGLARPVEITAGFGLVAMGLAYGRMTGRVPASSTVVAGAALAAGLALSLRTPGMYGIVLAHLHNVVTAVLLWHWRPDRRLRTGLLIAYAAVPALVLIGAVDPLLPSHLARTGPTHLFAASVTPPAWAATTLGIRVAAVFAFLQLVHYGVWCWLLPRRDPAPRPTRAAGQAGQVPVLAVLAFATALLALVFRADYATGRTLYGSLATYHAYLELPVVLMLLGGAHVPR
ncbi:MAG: hypothetical protein QOI20_946, partial [Acidimicrobiaceae bacterium]|nr:hypothetical protein [Acidimicrobiaceae bacterium]